MAGRGARTQVLAVSEGLGVTERDDGVFVVRYDVAGASRGPRGGLVVAATTGIILSFGAAQKKVCKEKAPPAVPTAANSPSWLRKCNRFEIFGGFGSAAENFKPQG